MAIGIERAILLETDGARLGSGRDGRRDRRRDPGPGGGQRPVRPDPVRQRVGRQRRLPGRDPGRPGARPADRHRARRALEVGDDGVDRPARGAGRRLGVVRASAAGDRLASRRGSTCRAIRRCRAGSGRGRRRSSGRRRHAGAGRPREDRPPPAAGGGDRGRGARPGRRRGAGRRRPARRDRGPRPMSGPVLALVTLAGGAPDRGVAGGADASPAGWPARSAPRSRRSSSPMRRTARAAAASLAGSGVATALVVGPCRPDARPSRRLGRGGRPGRRDARGRRPSSGPARSGATSCSPASRRGSGLPMAANCLSVEPGERYRLTRQRWAGSLLEDCWLDAPIRL